jgi:hypothetical protein
MPTTTSTTTFGGVETSNADSSKHTPRESRDLPPLLSSSYPITLKVQKQIYVILQLYSIFATTNYVKTN